MSHLFCHWSRPGQRWAGTRGSTLHFSSIMETVQSPSAGLPVLGASPSLPPPPTGALGVGEAGREPPGPGPGSPSEPVHWSSPPPTPPPAQLCPRWAAMSRSSWKHLQHRTKDLGLSIWEKHQDSSGDQPMGRGKQSALPSRILERETGWGTHVCRNPDRDLPRTNDHDS